MAWSLPENLTSLALHVAITTDSFLRAIAD